MSKHFLPRALAFVAGAAIALAAAGCSGGAPGPARPIVSAGPLQSVPTSSARVRVQLQLDSRGGLRTQALPLGWTVAKLELSNADLIPLSDTPKYSELARAAFTNNATTSPPVEFQYLRPGAGYVLNVLLADDGGVGYASGSATFTLTTADQLVQVPLAFTYDKVSTLAGSSAGGANGTGAAAQFELPKGVVVDSGGNIFVGDANNNKIRRIDAGTLEVTDFAGGGSAGFANGLGGLATFDQPQGLAIDGLGNIYVADKGNNAIRKITAAGSVMTIAGLGASSPGSADGSLAAATFDSPTAVAVDSAGVLYVSDSGNNRVRRVDPNDLTGSAVKTLAGGGGTGTKGGGYAAGTGTGAAFSSPTGIAYFGGNVYVADTLNHRIRKIDAATGVVTDHAGDGTQGVLEGPAATARFSNPRGLAVDVDGNLYVTHGNAARGSVVSQVSAGGYVSTLAGADESGHADGYGYDARFGDDAQALFAGALNNLYLADTSNHRIRKLETGVPAYPILNDYQPRGGVPGTVVTIKGAGFSRNLAANLVTFNGTSARNAAVDLDQGSLTTTVPPGATAGPLIVSREGHLANPQPYFQVIDPRLDLRTVAGQAGNSGSADGTGSGATLGEPAELATDGSNVFFADSANERVRQVTPAGVVTTIAGNGGASITDHPSDPLQASFEKPYGIARTPGGTFYVSDSAGHTIRRFTIGGAVETFAGRADTAGYADGQGAAAMFNQPHGLALDGDGNLYVADTGNNVIRKITPGGLVSTLSGDSVLPFYGMLDGLDRQARLFAPMSVLVLPGGDVVFSDTEHNAVRKVSPTGLVTTLAGFMDRGFRDGSGSDARFFHPKGLGRTADGSILVADSENGVIRRIDGQGRVVTVAGNGTLVTQDGVRGAASLKHPAGLLRTNDGLWVSDFKDMVLRLITGPGVSAEQTG